MLRHIQAGKLAEAASTVRTALPLAGVLGRLCHHPCEQGCRRGTWDDPAAIRDMERVATDWEFNHSQSEGALSRVICKPSTGKSVAIVGAGPAGLSAAYYLAREGHTVTVVDRHAHCGGSLRAVPEALLPSSILAAETSILSNSGVEFKLGVELGEHITVDGLSRGFDAILLAVGELATGDAAKLGLPVTGNALKVDPNNCRISVSKVFAAGAAVKPVKQLVRAMADGRAAAECVHRFLSGQPVRRPEKVFSSIMGRLEVGELRQFLATTNPGGCVTPCDNCAGFSPKEASIESSRCLHCDCRSSGNCLLQHYAQVYGAEASRFRAERRKFEQHLQPGGVIFEPGKCILCGICVKLTEMAREPLGLTFIGRGFDVKIGAPFNQAIEAGLQTIAEECVKQCPTGALEMA
jgi:ferredoxin